MLLCCYSASEGWEALGDQDTRICARKIVHSSQLFVALNCVVASGKDPPRPPTEQGLGAMSKFSLSKASGAKETKRPADAAASGASPKV